MKVSSDERWLIGLDIDGTVLTEDGVLHERVASEIRRVRDLGHEVMPATGRSVSMTLPVIDRVGIAPAYSVSANGAIVMRRDADAPMAYVRDRVATFDPREVLTTIRGHLRGASYAVEDAEGVFRYTGDFPEGALAAGRLRVEFDELLESPATRVVVLSPGHAIEDFLKVVERMGLHKVSYNVGWTAWLDIAPDGVNKGTGLEYVRERLDIPRERVMVLGDGRNDIDMFEWAASGGGVAVAMGQSPDEVRAVATDVTGTDLEQGVASALARYFQG
ncbi:HAD family hydrolase [Protaetiibacter mangrovi]|uniref:HAD-IIB family hydrolase n=1 Tax=Protaetiibacter mangrovi TaxID=2970926 RepID=A0ABT1ZGV6_9MICO|nr:HAD-IIB family hydrolase [Protaetiibacter mangrovi]MCS0499944.1 HAD-IIB family hydrolase [Protaetiibacter mangrovi]TPX03573.1 HAD-IIB family hydrolase [Schumannella luteola]